MRDTAPNSENPVVERLEAAAYTIPTDGPESDATMSWDSTTFVLVRAHGGGHTGIGYTYAGPAAVGVVTGTLAGVVRGRDAATPAASWAAMRHAVRNLGGPGLVAEAISAADIALWDLHARLQSMPLSTALGAVHEATPIYGSGGFTSYDDRRLAEQLRGWVDAGIPRVKMKVGRRPDEDQDRVRVARRAIGDDVELFVDANGAWTRKQALGWADRLADDDVRWLEEPVSSDDLDGLRLLRDRGPGGMDVAAGEYGYDLPYFHRMLSAEAVDCLQADVTRCGGLTALQRVAALCDARCLDLSLHCAPQVSAHAGTAVWHLRHLEYFHDHERIERIAFDGVLEPEPGGSLRPDRSRAGLGLRVRTQDLERYRTA
ncbi:Mandelate racemase/muconate lactonizing protein [Pseudonocardia dioxanivorans CB1190]|uniref:Mandelate racemase/muconate lactonizing protein n=1 Tax=Pseudonocardia dioxanivorans (strain ATCC 55486 / DSM 44775 / JCM 13855 / CB1190) TaxID=675635 RepID=F4CK34_PSEUX|nr:Mandelate racemase/muconate lactonizing protein [Pseudonocardia dioxanivorans CB1190]GJF06166.1 mandelate racemase [Pseudonocardia sp. D17]